jgi:outer membrane protein OmpA-like peptidoglycan-associated protein
MDIKSDHANQTDAAEEERTLEQLRELLFGEEIKHLNHLRAKIEDPSLWTGQVADVLAEAIEERNKQDDRVREVLQPSIEEALHYSVNKDPKPLTEALFPIIGPAIRRAVSETLNGMLRSFNQVLENSLSLQSLRWRLVAWRTGQPFSQVVLLHTLVYQVEQVFLIHQGSGLLLGHVQSENTIVQDPDMVSGMLTAIRDFITDSFAVEDGVQLASLRLGDLTVLVRSGPRAVLAAAVRGTPPAKYATVLSDALERYHHLYGHIMDNYDGDNSELEAGKYLLENCLQSQVTQEESAFSYKKPLLITGLILLALTVWGVRSLLDERAWHQGLALLDAEPGVVVLKDTYDSGDNSVSLLLDPMARHPDQIVGNEYVSHFSPVWQQRPYVSLEETIVHKRAHAVLMPPDTVELSLKDSVLYISGMAPQSWTDGLGTLVPGVHSLDTSGLNPSTRDVLLARLKKLRKELAGISFYFNRGEADLQQENEGLQHLMKVLRGLFDTAGSLGYDLRIQIVAYADQVGTSERNLLLSQDRANYILGQIGEAGLPVDRFEAVGGGIWIPSEETPTQELWRQRRVDFKLLLDQDVPAKGKDQK